MKFVLALVVVVAADYAPESAHPSVSAGAQVSVCNDDWSGDCNNLSVNSGRCARVADPAGNYYDWFLGCLKTCGCCNANKPSYCPADPVQALPVATALPGLVQGWNTSVGSVRERNDAADYFGVTIVDDESLWFSNIMSPFIGKTLHMTDITIIEGNLFNNLIQKAVNTGTVLWTVNPGPSGVVGPFTENINGDYTGMANTAGFVSATRWLENDNKRLFGLSVANDWGMMDVTSASETTVVMSYWSYRKGKFIMTWNLMTPDTLTV